VPETSVQPNQVFTASDKGSKFLKIAFIFLGIVTVVVMAEIAYFFSVRTGLNKKLSPQPTPQTNLSPATTDLDEKQEQRYYNVEKAIKFAEQFQNLKDKQEFFVSLLIKREISGIVTRSGTNIIEKGGCNLCLCGRAGKSYWKKS